MVFLEDDFNNASPRIEEQATVELLAQGIVGNLRVELGGCDTRLKVDVDLGVRVLQEVFPGCRYAVLVARHQDPYKHDELGQGRHARCSGSAESVFDDGNAEILARKFLQ
jgi:hypothetical protein